MRRVVDAESIQKAIDDPPLDTRAGARGLCVQKFLDDIRRIQWERISFKGGWGNRDIALDQLFDPREARAETERIRNCRTVQEVLNG